MRKLLFVALCAAACASSEEASQVTLTVSGIPAAADHLDVFVCSPSAASCTADNATVKYRPSFQPGALAGNTVDLAFAPLANAGAFDITVQAYDHNTPNVSSSNVPLASGTVSGSVPGTVALQVTLH